MAEFAGYVGNQVPPTDWGKVGTQLFNQYNEVKKDREEKRQVIEDDFATTFQKIGEYESTTNQTINEYLYKGVDVARNALKTQYDLLKSGAITMADYKLKKNTLTTDWGNISKALKNNAGIMESIQKMNASGEMSAVGRYRSEEYGSLLDIKDGQLMANPDTLRMYGVKANPTTGKVDSTSKVYSPTEAVNQYNIIDKKIDLNDGVTSFLKRVADYGIAKNLGGGRVELVENARQNPSYKTALEAQVNAMTVTPFNVASVLADYAGGYQVATEDKKKELIASGVKEENIILMQRVNGVLTPVPTKAQKEVAQSYVRTQIEVGVGQKESETAGWAPNKPDPAKEPSVSEKKMAYLYNSAVGLSKAYRNNPKDPAVIAKIKSFYSDNPGQIEIKELRDNEGRVIGIDLFEKNQDGTLKQGSMPSGAYDRIQIDPSALYLKMTARNAMGEEYGDVEMAKSAWIKGGGNPSETLFEYPSQRKAKGKRLLD